MGFFGVHNMAFKRGFSDLAITWFSPLNVLSRVASWLKFKEKKKSPIKKCNLKDYYTKKIFRAYLVLFNVWLAMHEKE